MTRWRILAALAVAGAVTAVTVGAYAAPESSTETIVCFDGFVGTPVAEGGVELACVQPPTTVPPTTEATTTTAAPTTTQAPTTTAPPTSTSSTTTTTVAPTTTQPAGPLFAETFDTAAGLDRFDWHVYHRNVDFHDFWGFSGGYWLGDHDWNCGTPDTKRSLSWRPADSMAVRIQNSVYWCNQHVMTSMGDVDAYSIVGFSPAQVFATARRVCVDVTLTNLGNRQWLKFGVVTAALFDSTTRNGRVPGWMVSDVPASDLPTSLATTNRLIASWSGGLSGGHPGGLKIGNTTTDARSNPTPNDKMTRHPVCLVDNGNGTVTFTVAGVSVTRSGAFPAGPVRVVFYDHNYTPSKAEDGTPQGYSWHWDNVVVD